MERLLWESFCDHSGPERVDALLPYLLQKPVPMSFYLNLHHAVGEAMKTGIGLPGSKPAEWGYFRGAFAKVLGEEYLNYYSSRERVLITGRRLMESLKTLSPDNLNVPHLKLAFKLKGEEAWYVCPDVMAVNVRRDRANLEAVYQCRTTLTAGSRPNYTLIRRTLANEGIKLEFQKAIGQIVEVPYNRVYIPNIRRVPFTLVAMSQGSEKSLAHKGQHKTEVAGIANMEGLSYRLLTIMAERAELIQSAVSLVE